MTLAKFVVIITIALTTIAVALIVGAVLLMEKEQKGGVTESRTLIEFENGPATITPINRARVIEWIPAEERLPEENKRILVTAEWDGDIKRVVETTRLPGEGKTRVWTFGYNGIVLAWAELPKPYKK